MFDPSIDTRALDKALKVIRSDMDNILGGEFKTSGQQLATFVVDDLRKGVAQITGNLQGSIVGDIVMQGGVEQETKFVSTTSPYDYAGRLDHDGRMTWRSGKFAGRKTFGWFSYVLPKLIKKLAKKYYTFALERSVLKIISAIGK